MILRRLTKIQKDEIVEAYRGGETANNLAVKYNCSSNTINRTVKALVSEVEYKSLKQKRLKSSNKKEDFEQLGNCNSPLPKVNQEGQSIENDDDIYNSKLKEITLLPLVDFSAFEHLDNEDSDIEKTNKDPENNFEEIPPLSSNFEIEKKELEFEIHGLEILPEIVYMLVDKKVELEVKSIYDLPEWGFLPENELKRNAILLFSNQRTAKRSCSKNQRVIKIPNTSVFEVSKSYLIVKGITRLILEESIIALDN